MNKEKFLTITTIALLAANLMLIWFLVSHRPHRPGQDGPRNRVIEKLSLDADQVKSYDQLIEWHKSEIERTRKQMSELKNQLFSTLVGDSSLSTEKDSVINKIGALQMEIENIHYKHFSDLKRLCKPEQQKAFAEFSFEIAKLFSPGPPQHRPE